MIKCQGNSFLWQEACLLIYMFKHVVLYVWTTFVRLIRLFARNMLHLSMFYSFTVIWSIISMAVWCYNITLTRQHHIFQYINPTFFNNSMFVVSSIHQKAIRQNNKVQKHEESLTDETSMVGNTDYHKNAAAYELQHCHHGSHLSVDTYIPGILSLRFIGQP